MRAPRSCAGRCAPAATPCAAPELEEALIHLKRAPGVAAALRLNSVALRDEIPPMAAVDAARLAAVFAPEVERLATLLGRDSLPWPTWEVDRRRRAGPRGRHAMNQGYDLRFEAPPPQLASLDLAELFRRTRSALGRNLWLILAAGLAFASLAAVLVNLQAPYYVARASLIIDPRVDESIGAVQAPTILLADALVVDSQVEVLRSEQIMQRVAARLDLASAASARLAAEHAAVPDSATLAQDVHRGLARSLDIEREGTTYVVRIAATSAAPAAAADLANAVADEYLAAQIETQAGQAEQAAAWLADQVQGMSLKVRAAETAVERFLYANDIPDENTQGAVEDELSAAEARLIAVRGDLRAARAEIDTIDRALAEDGPVAFRAQLVTALGGPADLRTTQIEAELVRLREARQARIDIARTELASLEAKAAELKGELADVAQKQVRLRELRREATAMQTQYESLLARFEESRGEGAFFRSNARVIERAVPPADPANPSAPLTVIAAALGGMIVGLGLTFLREQLDDRLRRSDDVVEQLGVPYLGAVPLLGRRDARHLPAGLATRADRLSARQRREIARLSRVSIAPHSLLAEPFRRTLYALRTRRRAGPQVVAVVSAVSGEGKSFFASNLAFLAARQGQRVLLIDGDLRNPHLSRSFAPLFPDPPADVASPAMSIAELAENLLLMYLRDPLQLDEAERQILAQGAAGVDLVIMDTAPMAYVADTLSLSSIADAAVLVVDWRRTSATTVRRTLRRYDPVAAKLIGACLSKSSPALMKRYEFIPANPTYYRSAPTAR